MTPALASIAEKLAKLLPLLGSDKAGEVSAAAAAISQTLRTAGADWHDIAGLLLPPSMSAPLRPAPSWSRTPTRFQSDLEAARWLGNCALTPWETVFVASIGSYLRAGRRLTSKQKSTLDEIVANYQARRRA